MTTQTLLTLFQLFLAFGNLIIMLYALSRFIRKPHDSLIDRIKVLEVEVEEIKASLKQDNKRFEKQFAANKVILKMLLALIEFEMNYCTTQGVQPTKDLERAKEELQAYLAGQDF